MRRNITIAAFLFVLLLTHSLEARDTLKIKIDTILTELHHEGIVRSLRFEIETIELEKKISELTTALKKATTTDEKVTLLLEKDKIKEKVLQTEALYKSDISKIRYLKGLQIIKILYEKTLALDHHFATVSTLNEINKMSNPNQYEDFRDIKELLENKRDKKTGFTLSSLLGNNIYTSVVHSVVSLFTSSQASKVEKETNLQNVECILDFTLRMHNDLNTIYFETAFLRKSNESIMSELEQLFKDYTHPIKYKTALKQCRENDDWSIIGEDLNAYLDSLNATIESGDTPSKVRTMQINLQFPIDRLLQFITQYNAFIDQGSKFYEKFGIMLNSYENEQQCASKIPVEYQTLKNSIALSIEKFTTAYKPVEINGSKLKQLLYGISEYD
tara:strand:- start:20237 stop:21397 length:1161 start_codon:yes stop_codon:yes gene_type:complete